MHSNTFQKCTYNLKIIFKRELKKVVFLLNHDQIKKAFLFRFVDKSECFFSEIDQKTNKNGKIPLFFLSDIEKKEKLLTAKWTEKDEQICLGIKTVKAVSKAVRKIL